MTNQKFLPRARLHTKDAIDNVFSKGQKLSRSSIAIFFCQNNLGHARLAVIVPKKSVKYATQRNVFKRVVRESFRLQQQFLPHIDVIAFVYATAKNFTKQEIRLCLDKQWQELSRRLGGFSPK